MVCGRRFLAHPSVGERQRTQSAECRAEDQRRQRRRRRARDGEGLREKEAERQRRHRKGMKEAIALGDGCASEASASVSIAREEGLTSGGVSRPELAPEVVVTERDRVAFLARRVAEMASELRGLTRTVQEVSSGLGSGRRPRDRGGMGVTGGSCHVQS